MDNNEKKEFVPMPTYPPQPKTTPKTVKRPGTGKDKTFGTLLAVLGILTVNCLLFGGIGIGAAALILIMFAATLIYRGKPKKMSFYAVILAIGVFALGAEIVFADSDLCAFMMLIAVIVLFDTYFIETENFRAYRGGSIRSLIDFNSYTFSMTFGKLGDGTYALFRGEKEDGEEKKKGKGKFGKILLGALIALPVLCVVVPLLISSDAAFEGLMNKLPDVDVPEIIVSVLFGLFIALLLFSRQFALKDVEVKQASKTERKGIDKTVIGTALVLISLVYVLYILSQTAYFFNAFSGLLKEGYTVAEYARRGFFEMCAVCFINLGIVFFGMFFCRKYDGKRPAAIRLLALFLCVFSLLLDATAMSKMVLYIKSFGMTKLRIVTSLFMIFLAIVFFSVILRLFIKKTPYMKIALIAAALIIGAAGFTGIDRFIADYNVDAYMSGKLDSVDTDTLSKLYSYSTVPALVRLGECDNSQLSKEACEILNDKYYTAFAEYDGEYVTTGRMTFDTEYKNWRGYRYFEYRGLELLKEKKELFFDGEYLQSGWYAPDN